MLEIFKLINGFDIVAPNTFSNRSATGLRRHKFKFHKINFCTNVSDFFFQIELIGIGMVYHSM